MKITLFTSNQSRHIALANSLAEIADVVYCVNEVSTVHPGKVEGFYKKSEIFQNYFSNVLKSEKAIFGDISFLKGNVMSLPVLMGDLNGIDLPVLNQALDSDIYVVFGASWIKGDLIDFLISKKAINIHMGISPYYRGTACNFWAAYDNNPEYIGATIHYLSKGLDSGPMVFHALPEAKIEDKFLTGMRSVKSAHLALKHLIKNEDVFNLKTEIQDKSKEIRYSKNSDFTDEIALDFMNKSYSKEEAFEKLNNRDLSLFLNPQIF